MKHVICNVYRSKKKDGMYLYVAKAKPLTDLPEQLMALFGKPELAMTLALTPEKRLARADASKVCACLEAEGYYLQMPPTIDEDMQRIHQLNSKFQID